MGSVKVMVPRPLPSRGTILLAGIDNRLQFRALLGPGPVIILGHHQGMRYRGTWGHA
jgi:hypothetical protein